MSLKFFEAFSYFAWKYAAVNLKGYFEILYETNEEYDGDEAGKKLHGLYFQTLELIVGIISKTPSNKLKYLDSGIVGDLFSTLQHFNDCEKSPENKAKWSRLYRKLLLGIERNLLGTWISTIPLEQSKFGSKRIRRFYYQPFETSGASEDETAVSSLLLHVNLNYINYFRTLEADNILQEIQAVQHLILSIPEPTVLQHHKQYLNSFVDILVNFALNEKDPAVIKRLKLLLVDIGKRFRWCIENQLKDSEQNAKIRRLDLLKEIWAQLIT